MSVIHRWLSGNCQKVFFWFCVMMIPLRSSWITQDSGLLTQALRTAWSLEILTTTPLTTSSTPSWEPAPTHLPERAGTPQVGARSDIHSWGDIDAAVYWALFVCAGGTSQMVHWVTCATRPSKPMLKLENDCLLLRLPCMKDYEPSRKTQGTLRGCLTSETALSFVCLLSLWESLL